MTKSEIKKAYAKLLEAVKNDKFYDIDLSNRVNCYTCSCGHITKTIDVDAGVTPFMHFCEKCNKTATSSMYNDRAPDQKPTLQEISDHRPSVKSSIKPEWKFNE
jgi:hypothetical protein